MPFINGTHTSSTGNASTPLSNQTPINNSLNATGWYDPASNLGYGVGRLLRGALDHVWQTWQGFWYPPPSQAEIAVQKQQAIYRQGIEECVKHLDRALENARKNPNDPQSLKRIEKLALHYEPYLKTGSTADLKAYQQTLFEPIIEKIAKLAHPGLKNSLLELLPIFSSKGSPVPFQKKEKKSKHENQKRGIEQTINVPLNTVNLPLDNQAKSMAIEQGYAYTVNGEAGLKIVDVRDPNNPTLVSQYDTPGDAQRIVLDKGYAYIADGTGGLQIVNVKNATNPIFAGLWMTGKPVTDVVVLNGKAYIADGTDTLTEIEVNDPESVYQAIVSTTDARDVAVSGDMVYVADYGAGLRVIDVSNSPNPRVLGSVGTTGALGVAVSGNMVYVADGSSGLRVIDVSNSTNPSVVGSVDTTGALGVAVSGNMVYVADGPSGLLVIDVSNSTNPSVVGSVSMAYAQGVAVSGTMVYVGDASRLCVIDVSNATNPRLLGSVSTRYAQGVAVSGTMTYVADQSSGLRVIDVSNGTKPRVVGSAITTNAQGVAVSGTRAYVADRTSGLRMIDVSNSTNPILVGSVSTKYAWDVAVSGTMVYVADGTSGLRIIGISPLIVSQTYVFRNVISQLAIANNQVWVMQSGGFQAFDPAIPILLGSNFAVPNALSVAVSGTRAYVAYWVLGLGVIDVSNGTNPRLVGSVSTTNALGIAVSGTRVYVADYNSGLHMIDVSNSTNPKVVGSVITTTAQGVAVSGTMVYVADQSSGLRVIDVSNSTNPRVVGSVDTTYAQGVAVSGTMVYVADYTSGLRVIDVSNGTNPNVVGSVSTTYAYGVAVSGTVVYVADGSSGLRVIDVSNSTNPRVVGSVSTTYAYGVAVSGTVVYVADGSSGLRVIDVTNSTNPYLSYGFGILGISHAVEVSNNVIYVAGDAGLTVFNAEQPLPWLPYYAISPPLNAMTIAYPYAFVANNDALGVWNIGDPKQSEYLGGWNTSFMINRIDVMGNKLLLGYSGGIAVLDISDPGFPQLIRNYNCTQSVQDFLVNNGTLYLSSSYQCQFEPAFVPDSAPAPVPAVPQPSTAAPTPAPQLLNGTTPCPADQLLMFGKHDIQISKGQRLRLTPNDVSGNCGNMTTPNLGTAFTVTGIDHGRIERRNGSGFWNPGRSFFGNDLAKGNVALVHDNSSFAPEVNVSMTDGQTTLDTPISIHFNETQSTAQVGDISFEITANGVTVLSPSQFQITDTNTRLSNIVISVDSVEGGYFKRIEEDLVKDFTYYQLETRQIQFVHEGASLPKITLSVGDGTGQTVKVTPMINFFDINNPNVPSVPIAVIAGVSAGVLASAAVAGIVFFKLKFEPIQKIRISKYEAQVARDAALEAQ